jgi:small subunit ribosomal protein S8
MLDPISDMLTRIRNAGSAGHTEVIFPSSKMKAKLAGIILDKNMISGFSVEENNNRKAIKINLKYFLDDKNKKTPQIQGIRRVSKQGQRIYVKKDEIPRVKNGYGFAIISTSKGLLTDNEARRTGLGGEIICEIW